jgi:hypothetical protein
MLTQDEKYTDQDRIDYYVKVIESGQRPLVFIVGDENNYFLVDGHHKWKAYNELRINPIVVQIFIDVGTDIQQDLKFWKETSHVDERVFLSRWGRFLH